MNITARAAAARRSGSEHGDREDDVDPEAVGPPQCSVAPSLSATSCRRPDVGAPAPYARDASPPGGPARRRRRERTGVPRPAAGTIGLIHLGHRNFDRRRGPQRRPAPRHHVHDAGGDAPRPQASTRRSIRAASYRGSIAGTMTRNVTAPEPSRWTSAASSDVPGTIDVGRVPTTRAHRRRSDRTYPRRSSRRRTGSRRRTSPPPARGSTGRRDQLPDLAAESPREGGGTGTTISATSGVTRRLMIAASKSRTVAVPSKASIG